MMSSTSSKLFTSYETMPLNDNIFNVREQLITNKEEVVIIKEEYFEEEPLVTAVDSKLTEDCTSKYCFAGECLPESLKTIYEDNRVKENKNVNDREELVNNEEIVIIKEEYFEEEPAAVDSSLAVDRISEYSSAGECLSESIKTNYNNGNTTSNTNTKYYACIQCGSEFSNKKKLSAHIQTHDKVPFFCDLCNRKFTIKSCFDKHMIIHTEQRSRYFCEVCDKKFFYKSHFVTHRRIHAEGFFTCDVCKKRLSHKYTLTTHMRTHTGERPYGCNVCELRYSHSSTLTAHIRTHTGQKPYACFECDKSFTQKSYLNAHIRTHTGEKPFACSICDKKFRQKSVLNIHLRIHTGERAYACDKCEMKFSNSSSLSKHKKTHNKKKRMPKKGVSTKHKKAQQQSLVSQVHATSGTKSYENATALNVNGHSAKSHVKHEFVTSEEENTSEDGEYINIEEEFVKEEPVVTAVDSAFAID